ncbi:MAG: hypothetical protein IRZ14_19030 [Chloroflexi bacterium]|nr:hypothetical protein [Chloroflexota bacterium]
MKMQHPRAVPAAARAGGMESCSLKSTTPPRAAVELRTPTGQRCGVVLGDVAHFTRSRARHFHRTRGGWYFHRAVLLAAQQAGARTVVVVERESGDRYIAALQALLGGDQLIDERFGEQVGLPLRRWRREPAHAHQLALALEGV